MRFGDFLPVGLKDLSKSGVVGEELISVWVVVTIDGGVSGEEGSDPDSLSDLRISGDFLSRGDRGEVLESLSLWAFVGSGESLKTSPACPVLNT